MLLYPSTTVYPSNQLYPGEQVVWFACDSAPATAWERCAGETSGAEYERKTLEYGPWGYWRLAEAGPSGPGDALDSSGNARHGTYDYVAEYGVPGVVVDDTAIRGFGDTVDGRAAVDLPDAVWDLLRGISFTCAFWAIPTRDVYIPPVIGGVSNTMYQQDGAYVIRPMHGALEGASTGVGMGISFGTNALLVIEHTTNFMPVRTLVEYPFSPDEYHFIVVRAIPGLNPTYPAASTYEVFVDGVYAADLPGLIRYVETTPETNAVAFASSNICQKFYGTNFGGLLDEWAYFDRALTSQEIADLYDIQQGGLNTEWSPCGAAPATAWSQC